MDCEDMSREELMKLIMQNKFAINDMALYLDTHPCDNNALRCHNEFVRKYKEYKEMYERKYGPLSIETEMDSWQWVEDPWPWEGEMR